MNFTSRRVWTRTRIDVCWEQLDHLRRGNYTIDIHIVEELLEHLKWLAVYDEGQRAKYRPGVV